MEKNCHNPVHLQKSIVLETYCENILGHIPWICSTNGSPSLLRKEKDTTCSSAQCFLRRAIAIFPHSISFLRFCLNYFYVKSHLLIRSPEIRSFSPAKEQSQCLDAETESLQMTCCTDQHTGDHTCYSIFGFLVVICKLSWVF